MSLHYGGRGPGHLSRWPKGAGVWNLANWYAADPTRYTTTPWYETDKAYLFQDVLAATPVTAPGDPVRLVKAKNGNTNHDLLIHTTGSPATYRERSGVGYVEHNGAALQMRGTATMSLPFFILGAHARPGRVAQGSLFGLYKASNQFLTLWDAGSTQNRISTRSREAVSGPVLKNSQGAFRQSPLSAPQVLDSLFKAGYQDIGVNGQARFTDTNTWTGSEAVTGAELGTNLNGASAPFSNVHDFYGGWAYWGDPGEDLRQNVVNYFRRKI